MMDDRIKKNMYIHTYVGLGHYAVQQRLVQQLKKKKGKKMRLEPPENGYKQNVFSLK